MVRISIYDIHRSLEIYGRDADKTRYTTQLVILLPRIAIVFHFRLFLTALVAEIVLGYTSVSSLLKQLLESSYAILTSKRTWRESFTNLMGISATWRAT